MGALRRFMVDTEFYIKGHLGGSFKAFYGRHVEALQIII